MWSSIRGHVELSIIRLIAVSDQHFRAYLLKHAGLSEIGYNIFHATVVSRVS